jgi:hypothetical protein
VVACRFWGLYVRLLTDSKWLAGIDVITGEVRLNGVKGCSKSEPFFVNLKPLKLIMFVVLCWKAIGLEGLLPEMR